MKRLIFGCGYLGSRVADRWLQTGDTVYAVTRSTAHARRFESLGIKTIVSDITKPATLVDLPNVDTVLFAVGMDRSTYSDIRTVYVDGLHNVLQRIETRHLIYVSSTGVYGNFDGHWIDENSPTDPQREGGQACLEAERLIQNSDWSQSATILRFAGIYGPGRVPTKSTIQSKSWSKLNADGYLNLIQVDDGARIIKLIAEPTALQNSVAETFLVSDGAPPRRKEYYEFIAHLLGDEQIPWDESDTHSQNSRSNSSKRVSNRKLVERFQVQFEFPDYQSGVQHALK